MKHLKLDFQSCRRIWKWRLKSFTSCCANALLLDFENGSELALTSDPIIGVGLYIIRHFAGDRQTRHSVKSELYCCRV